MGNGVLTAAEVAGIHASVTALNALFRDDAQLRNVVDGTGPDVLQRAYEIRLERLGVVARLEAQIAALKARDAAEAVELQNAMTPPDARLQERTFREISVVEEIAGILTISSGAAGAFITQARRVCSLPSVYEALSCGALSWQGARIIADETENLDHPAAVALADHFLDPDAPNLARGCPATNLVPSRLRAKVRAWRERHHPESIEKRHTKSAADRRVEFTPDRDGMAWFAIYMRADCALAAWNKTTAIARGLQGHNETRTLTQIRADEVARRLLAPAQAITTATDAGTGTGTGSGSGSGPSMASPAGGGNTEGAGGQRGSQPGTSNAAVGDGSGHPGTGDQVQGATKDQFPDKFLGLATLDGSDEPTADLGIPDALAAVSLEASSAGTQDNSAGQAGTCTTTASPDATSPEAGKVPTPRTDVLVTVPVFALLGLTDEPATLDGYGPIPASMARKLLADGAESFTRVLIDPRDGAPLEIGRTSYRLTKAMRQALTLRDGKCTFPGCNNNALDNEADHLQAWQHGGSTGISNLAQLCPKHHRLKHNSGWTPTEATHNTPPGWTSPTGRQYASEHAGWEPPQLPSALTALSHDGAAPGNPGSGWSAARKRGLPATATDEQQVVLSDAPDEHYPAAAAAGMPEAGEDLVCPPWLEWGDIEITDADVPDPDIIGDTGFPDDPELLEFDPAQIPVPDWLLWLEAGEAALSRL
ncbi:HNH endonuclease signature motif containing protein [Arthrobacter nitrophenolicus]|uniref:HNH endonuclease signature motif containing protein n=1 Tax=Arthrobacter nitrophenolicus TaxID=683150 RepID=UPI001F0CE5F5|nr:HNH endonuclease signature motif containing protein [Arthrobacter nitrophenolicus]